MSRANDPQAVFKHWIKERHSIYLRKQERIKAPQVSGVVAHPLTDDPILAGYRFCNVYRQLDKVTVWLNESWYPLFTEDQIPFAACVARLVNDIGSLGEIKKNVPLHPAKILSAMNYRKSRGESIRGAAYIVSTNGRTMPFPEYITSEVLGPLHTTDLGHPAGATLASYAAKLQGYMGIASFIAGQVVADMKYHYGPMKKAPDWWSFVVPGPGSKRGLNRLHGRPCDAPMADRVFHSMFPLAELLADDTTEAEGWPCLHAQDVQNCLCEFDKYMRALTGEGKPKQRYPR